MPDAVTDPTHTFAWPYPKWVAHRGAGKLAPENTLAAFKLGAARGYRMFECDAKLSADEVVFLLHDASLERTSNGQGTAGDWPWSALSTLDAGSWHSSAYAGEPLARLDELAHWCIAHGHALNIEIKPTPGHAHRTGEVVAALAQQLWQGQAVSPLLTSFQVASLRAAQDVAPALPRGLLLDVWGPDCVALARALGCVAVVCQHRLWTAQRVQAVQQHGMKALSYTVNDEADVAHLEALGTDGIITDRVDWPRD